MGLDHFKTCSLAWLLLVSGLVQAGLIRSTQQQVLLQNGPELIKERILSFMHEKAVPAISLAVTKDDRLVYARAFGYANLSDFTEATPEYRFRVASVSKTMTSISIMDLVAKGYLSIDSKVFGIGAVLGHDFGKKPYSDRERAITVQHLLEHSSGFDDGTMGGDPTYQQRWLDQSHNELIGTILDEYDPSADPGTNASYSNFGFMVLGRVVEKVAGKDYSQYTKEMVLNPVGARHMEIGGDPPKLLEVVYYDKNKTAPYTFHISRRDSVGAWIARPIDLVAVTSSVNGYSARPDILPEEIEDLMYEKSDIKNSTYAKGWDEVIFSEQGSLIEANKNGGFPGTTAWISVRPPQSITYAVAANKAVDTAADLKALVDGIVQDVDTWPHFDLFPKYGIRREKTAGYI